MPRQFGQHTPEELAEARAIATDAIEMYGDFPNKEIWDQFREKGIWNDHVAVQAAIVAVMARNDAVDAHDKLDREIAQHDTDRSAERVARMKAEQRAAALSSQVEKLVTQVARADELADELAAERKRRRALERSDQARAAHVDRLRQTGNRVIHYGCNKCEWDDAVNSLPETSLAHLKAQAAITEVSDLIDVIGPDVDAAHIVVMLRARIAAHRREAVGHDHD